jgi:hypothetical protein
MSTGPRGGHTGGNGPRGSGGWLAPLGRNTWYLAIVAVALGLTAGGVVLLAQGSGTPSHRAEPDCGLINCGASLPGPSPTASTQSQITKAHTTVSHPPAAPAQPAPPATAPSSPAATPAAPAPANVSVTVTSDRNRRDSRFQDQMTLVNNGGSPVSGWTVQLTLPVEEVDSVEIPSGWWDGTPFEHWQFSGDTLTISADSDSETLGPGAPLNLSIHGRGDMALPTGCTFNGAACPGLRLQAQPDQWAGQQDPPAGQQDPPPTGDP